MANVVLWLLALSHWAELVGRHWHRPYGRHGKPNGLRQTAVWVKANVRLLLTTHLYRIKMGLRWHGVADPLSGGRSARDRPPHRAYPRQRQRPTLNRGP